MRMLSTKSVGIAIGLAAGLMAATAAPAATWTAGAETWDNADGSNWDTANPPGDQDHVNLTQTSSGDFTITYAAPVPADGGDSNTIGAYASFELSNTGAGRTTLDVGSGDTLKAASENFLEMVVGDGGTIDQTGGTVDYSVGAFELHSGGRYELSGGDITSSGGATQDIKILGGTYVQDGGTAAPGDRFVVSAGSVTFSPGATVNSNAQFQQTGGTVNQTGGTVDSDSDLKLRGGEYNVSGGTKEFRRADISNGQSTDATLTVSGAGSVSARNGFQSYELGGGSGIGKIVVTGGSISGGDFLMSENSVVRITGGSFNVGSYRDAGSTPNNRTIRILGGGASLIDFARFEVDSPDILEYTVESDGLTAMDVGEFQDGFDSLIDMELAAGVSVGQGDTFDLLHLSSGTIPNTYTLATEDQSEWMLQTANGGQTLQAVSTIPEPASLTLLAPAGLLVLRRRRATSA